MAAVNAEKIPWRLAQLWLMHPEHEPWTSERMAKTKKCAPRFCPICAPKHTLRLRHALTFPILNLPLTIHTRSTHDV